MASVINHPVVKNDRATFSEPLVEIAVHHDYPDTQNLLHSSPSEGPKESPELKNSGGQVLTGKVKGGRRPRLPLKRDEACCKRGASSGPLTSRKQKVRYGVIVGTLVVLAVAIAFAILSWDNGMEFGSAGYWKIASMRADVLIAMVIVAICQAFATVAFQTVTGNRIITPSIMGFEALYTVIQTGVVFFFGAAGVTMVMGAGQFLLQAVLMVGLACLLYGWLLSGRFGNMHIMLLVGVVVGGGLGALSTFMQRMMDPNEFDILTARLFGNLSNADSDLYPIVIPIVLVTAALLWVKSPKLNTISLGKDVSTNLGVNHRREVMIVLFLVSILMAMTTSLVGPMTFLGFLVATLAYSLTDTYDHKLIFPVASLLAFVVLGAAYFVLRNIFYAGGAVTIIIELVGGVVFLFVIMRKGRL
ncbi:iron chelate uptake ABC transporter family permease subunit [Flaviflexus massiliensis]|uniref:iron chelate uptake ABC transporter family permease subunit n=1 Tax=Flaviflexus massiliensis TaxID=1522309 RepID=UPI0009EB34C7|nr:iron chelate uptake ABC transporter family permease subunit [Flaviflexus massiliensis]